MLEQLRPLIGREADVERASALLLDEGVRLLTLVGPGGVGKTRLARAVAAQLAGSFVEGLCFVDLSPVRDPGLVLSSIAQAIGAREVEPRGFAAAIAEIIGARRMLLILDNFEQVTGAAVAVGDLLAACPELRVLVTSREPLALAWEQLFEVGPLEEGSAIELFVQQARLVRPSAAYLGPNDAAVVEICRRLDGLPLAIELAAARTRLLSPEAIRLQLRDRPLALLASGPRDAPARHRTLRDAIAWSYELLEPPHQALFRHISVFIGGCTFAGIQAVYDLADLGAAVESLLDKHLLAIADVVSDELRFQQLETIREYAAEQLRANGEADAARARHAEYLVRVVGALAPELYGRSQAAAAQQLLADHNNLRAALDWSAHADDALAVELGLQLAGSLWLFWRVRGFVTEGRERLALLLARAGVRIDGHGVDLEHAAPSTTLARALHAAGYLAFAQAAAADAHMLLSASLEVGRIVDDPWSQSYALHGLGHAALLRSDFAEARLLYEQRLAIARQQHDEYAMGQALNALGEVARCLNEPGVARDFYEQSLQVRRRLGDTRGVAMGLANLGQVLAAEGATVRAREVLTEALASVHELGHRYGEAVCFTALASVAAAEGQAVIAARLLGAAATALEGIGDTLEPPDLVAYERTLASARTALGLRFDAEFGQGRRMTVADAECIAIAPSQNREAPGFQAAADSGAATALSPREREVVALIARGCTSEEIAAELVISRRTADTHAEHVRDKLGLRSRAEIAVWAIRHGLAS